MYSYYSTVLTQLCGRLHQAPGLAPALANDQVQQVGLQPVLEDLPQGWTQVLEDQVSHVRTHPAVPQLGLGMIKTNFTHSRWGMRVTWSCPVGTVARVPIHHALMKTLLSHWFNEHPALLF